MDDMIPEKIRAWLYRLGMAIVPLLVGYGLVDDGKAALWVGVLGALLGFGLPALASAYTSTKSTRPDQHG